MLKAVIDTNVWNLALLTAGNARELTNRLRTIQSQLFYSEGMFKDLGKEAGLSIKFQLLCLMSLATLSSSPCVHSAEVEQPSLRLADAAIPKTDIGTFLSRFDELWNAHDLEGIAGLYHEGYLDADGLTKKDILARAQQDWKTSPESKRIHAFKMYSFDGQSAKVPADEITTGGADCESAGTPSKLEIHTALEILLLKSNNKWLIVALNRTDKRQGVAYNIVQASAATLVTPGSAKSNHSLRRREFRITADQFSRERNRRMVVAMGNAEGEIVGQNAKIRADLITFDKDSRIVDAHGHVSVLRDGHVTTGSGFKFRADSDEYLVTQPDIRATGPKLIHRSKAK